MGNNETNVSGYEILGKNKSEVCCSARSASLPLWEKDSKQGLGFGFVFFPTEELKMKGGAIHRKEEGRQVHSMEMTCLEQPQKQAEK